MTLRQGMVFSLILDTINRVFKVISVKNRIQSRSIIIFAAIAVIAFESATPGTCSAEEKPCMKCHTKFREPAKSVHAALASGCQTCHTTAKGKKHPVQKNSIILIQQLPGLCYNCHEASQFKGSSVYAPVEDGMCNACHDPHQSNYSSLLLKQSPVLCYTCHDKVKFEGKYGHTAVGMCVFCHNPHASNYSTILKKDVPDVCFTCHDEAQFKKKYVHPIVTIPNGCTLCHNPHANDNQSALLRPTFDLCASCHSGKADGRHILAEMNLEGREVIHPVKGVPDPAKPSGKLSCISCHEPHSSDFPKLFVEENLCKRCHKRD